MTIREVYLRFSIPPNLQDHMLRVARVVLYVKSKWNGPHVDWENLLKAALLHDLGNIVRFKFDSASISVYGEEAKRLDFWKEKQREMAIKYGNDDHEATRAMLREINIDTKIVDWILSKSFANAEEIKKGSIWEDKILLYSDMRVLPSGIGSLQERLNELEKRRNTLTSDPAFESRVKACRELESQVEQNLFVSVSSITDSSVLTDDNSLLDIEIDNRA